MYRLLLYIMFSLSIVKYYFSFLTFSLVFLLYLMLQASFHCIALYYITIAITPWFVVLAFVFVFPKCFSYITLIQLRWFLPFMHFSIFDCLLFCTCNINSLECTSLTITNITTKTKQWQKNISVMDFPVTFLHMWLTVRSVYGLLYYKASAGVYSYFFLFIRKNQDSW